MNAAPLAAVEGLLVQSGSFLRIAIPFDVLPFVRRKLFFFDRLFPLFCTLVRAP